MCVVILLAVGRRPALLVVVWFPGVGPLFDLVCVVVFGRACSCALRCLGRVLRWARSVRSAWACVGRSWWPCGGVGCCRVVAFGVGCRWGGCGVGCAVGVCA